MKRVLLFAISIILIITFVGCNQAEDGSSKDTETNIGTNTSVGSSKPGEVGEIYYGKWQIVKELAYAPVGTYSNDDVKTIIGRELILSEESATCFGDQASYLDITAVNPAYKKSVVNKNDFEINYRVTFDKLGISGDTVTQIEAVDEKGNGCTFFIKDNNTLILYGGGVFFELNKI